VSPERAIGIVISILVVIVLVVLIVWLLGGHVSVN
jgi:hypothetical protein